MGNLVDPLVDRILAEIPPRQGLGVQATLCRKRRRTNAIEKPSSGAAACAKNVKRWHSGSMIVGWVSAATVEAEKKLRRVQG